MKSMRRIFLFTFGGMGLLFAVIGGGLLLFLTSQGLPLLDSAGLDEEQLTMHILGWTYLPLGLIFLSVGLGIYGGMKRAASRREELAACGVRVRGTVKRVALNPALRVNRRSPYRVYVTCTPPQVSSPVTLRSHNVFHTDVRPGDSVWVLFDPMDERRYAVELPGGED